MYLELNFVNIIQLFGLGINLFIICLLLILDKGIYTKTFFLKVFFISLFLIQFIVFLKKNQLFIFSQPYQHFEKLFSLFLIILSLISVFNSLYFYIKSLMNKLNYLSTARVFTTTIFFSLLFTIEGAYEIFGLSNTSLIVILGFGVLTLALYFSFKTISVVKEYERMIENNISYTEGVSLKWLNYIIIYFFLFILGFIVDSITRINGFTALYMVIFLVVMGFFSIKNFTYYKSIDINLDIDDTDNALVESTVPSSLEPSSSKEQRLYLDIIELVQTKELYLNNSLTLVDFSREVGVNYKYVSKVINEFSNKSFLEFINEYRVKKAKELLIDDDFRYLAIDDIAYQSGFKSKATFYKYFKKHFKQTPSTFRDKYQT